MLDSNDVSPEVMSDMAKSIDFHWIKTPQGNLVVFNPEHFFYDLWGKTDFDNGEKITEEQWKDFVYNNQYLDVDYKEPPPIIVNKFTDLLNDLDIEVDE